MGSLENELTYGVKLNIHRCSACCIVCSCLSWRMCVCVCECVKKFFKENGYTLFELFEGAKLQWQKF